MEKEQNQNLENSTSEEKGNGEDEQKETSIISKNFFDFFIINLIQI